AVPEDRVASGIDLDSVVVDRDVVAVDPAAAPADVDPRSERSAEPVCHGGVPQDRARSSDLDSVAVVLAGGALADRDVAGEVPYAVTGVVPGYRIRDQAAATDQDSFEAVERCDDLDHDTVYVDADASSGVFGRVDPPNQDVSSGEVDTVAAPVA